MMRGEGECELVIDEEIERTITGACGAAVCRDPTEVGEVAFLILRNGGRFPRDVCLLCGVARDQLVRGVLRRDAEVGDHLAFEVLRVAVDHRLGAEDGQVHLGLCRLGEEEDEEERPAHR